MFSGKYFIQALLLLIFLFGIASTLENRIFAAERVNDSLFVQESATVSAEASESGLIFETIPEIKRVDITQPEQPSTREKINSLFQQRPASSPNIINFMAYLVQYAFKVGVPSNTIVLILLLPFLATAIAFIRLIIGLQTMEMLVPIILAVTFIATGITVGSILLIAILIGSFLSRFLLKRVKIMQIPKMATSLLLVSVFVFITLLLSAIYGLTAISQISIFPVLILILLSDRIVALQLERKFYETLKITFVTVAIAILGYVFLINEDVENFILIYPEVILILLPINFLIGRYFGLRLTEYLRFSPIMDNGNK